MTVVVITNLFPLVVLLFFSSGDITLSILWKLNMKRNLIFYYHVCSLLLVVELQSLGDPWTLAEICRRAKCHSLDLLCIVSQNCSLNLAAVNEVRHCGHLQNFYQHLFILSDHFVHVERNHLDQLKRPSATYKMSLIKMLSIVIMWE